MNLSLRTAGKKMCEDPDVSTPYFILARHLESFDCFTLAQELRSQDLRKRHILLALNTAANPFARQRHESGRHRKAAARHI